MINLRTLATSAALCLAPLLSACATNGAQTSSGDAAIAAQAAALVENAYAADGPGGAVLVARGDEIIYRGARGEADIDGNVALQPGDVFRLGSVTKQFAAAGLLRLVEEGRVGIDDPISRFLPDYPRGGEITIRMILNHTSGIRNYTDIEGYMNPGGPIINDATTEQMIDVFENLPLDFEPGTQWNYSNSGYVLVGAVIEAVTGTSWHEYLDRTFFHPLGMEHTGYGHDPRFAAMQVGGYSVDDGVVTPMMTLSMTQPHAAGALVSNVDDLLIWNRALHEGRVLSNPIYIQMITPTGAAAEPQNSYGFGVGTRAVRGTQTIQHGGGIFGFITSLVYVPGPDLTIVVLENDDSGSNGSADSTARRLTAIALGNPYPDPTPIQVDVATLEALQGIYRFNGDVTRTLRVVDGRLTAQRGTNPRLTLIPIAPDDFVYEGSLTRLTIVRDASGAVTGFRFFNEGEGEGELGALTGDQLPPLPVAMDLPRPALERVVGNYTSAGPAMNIFIDDNGRLHAQFTGQRPVTLRALSATLFEVEEVPAQVIFPEGDAQAASAIIRQGGQDLPFTRVP